MYGDLQAVTGRSLPTIAALELPQALASAEAAEAVDQPAASSRESLPSLS